ncbi:Condensation domain-containing protein [Williamsia sterculiae]|uniref:Condensation domain-containing protein n=2 Tax=Williamsia sterculiae TaxID=1344003 RepID=A0A1N7DTB6_9NOCA|nr:Condensation domain-containing protein [Williamsia sterculiae]
MGAWQPAPGEALRWLPTPRCRAAAGAAPVRDAPLSFLTENDIRRSHAAHAQCLAHTSYLGSATELDGDLDLDALTRALEAFVGRHPILRSWFESGGDGAVATHVVDPAAVAFEVHSDGPVTSSDSLQSLLRHRLGTETTTDVFPGLAFGAIRRTGGFSMYLGCDHALSDGASQALALAEIAELYLASRADEPVPPTGEGGGYFDYVSLEIAAAEHHMAGSPQFRAWQDTFTRHDLRMPGFPLDLGLAPGETAPVRPIEMPILDRAGVTDFDIACKAAGGSVFSGVYAALAIAARELTGADEYYGMTVLNSRGAAPQFTTAQGWFCAFSPVEIPLAGARAFTDVVAIAHAAVARTKELAAVPVQAALAAMVAAGASQDAVVTAPNLLSYIDFRWFPADAAGAYDRGILFTGEGRTGNASLWINRDHDSLYLGSQTPDTPYAQQQVARYLDRFCAVVQAVAATGDHLVTTPDDRPLTTYATGAASCG